MHRCPLQCVVEESVRGVELDRKHRTREAKARGVVAIEACTMAPGRGGVRRTSRVVCTKHQVDEWGERGERWCAYREVMMAVSGEEL